MDINMSFDFLDEIVYYLISALAPVFWTAAVNVL